MPVATFADPSVAIEPPPQGSEYDSAMSQALMFNPFALIPSGAVTLTAAESRAEAGEEKGWFDVFKGIGTGFLNRLIGGYDLNDPHQLALYQADKEAQRKAEQQKLFLIVGGVGAAVVLGALVLSRRK